MSDPVRVLILEDNPDDAELAIIELERAGLAPNWRRVETKQDFEVALTETWDLILADNNLPTFDGKGALQRVAALGVETPFIIVSGSIGEEEAVAGMQSGAADYVLKDRLARLGQAARRALERRADQVRRAEAEQRLQQLERLRGGVELATDLAASLEPQNVLERVLRRLVAAAAAETGVLLAAADEQALEVVSVYDPEGRLPETWYQRIEAAALLAAAAGSGVAIRDAELEGLAYGAALALRTEASAVLVVVGRTESDFTDSELETLNLLGSVAVLALRNAELFSAAAAASEAKSEFLNMAAHELRTPLSVINGYVSMLRDGTLGPPASAWMDVIEILSGKTVELSHLVDSILTAARLESSALDGNEQELDLVQLASESLRRAEPRARLLEANVLLDAPDLPVLVRCDPEQVARILDNLVDNALTYAGTQPWVRLSVKREGRVEVEDAGPGIPEECRERVFERFYRVSGATLPPQPGTGLGLFIARGLAERNHATLELAPSWLGRGARFVLRFAGAAPEVDLPQPADQAVETLA
ncbi:MAG TPA: hybrid sensor histidine kinase/response regulator [Candidatus Dormibacteraeota bacterium]